MRSSTTRSTKTRKATEGEAVATTKTAPKKKTDSKSTMSRTKSDGTGRRKSSVSDVSATDYANLPSFMRPTLSSQGRVAKGSLGGEETEIPKLPTKPGGKKKSSKPSTGAPKRPKKTQRTPKSSDVERSPVPSVDTPTPVQISTETGADASAVVGLAPATPQTPGQDPIPHISDNDSTEATRETQDKTTTAQTEGEMTTVEAQQRGESEPVESEEASEASKLMTKAVDTSVAENLVTTDTVVGCEDSDEEEQRQSHIDPVATEALVGDPPSAEATEARTEEATEDAIPPPEQADPGVEAPIENAVPQQTESTEQTAPVEEEKESPEDPQDPVAPQTSVAETSQEKDETDPTETMPKTEEPVEATESAKEVEVGTDPKEETAEQPVAESSDQSALPEEKTVEVVKEEAPEETPEEKPVDVPVDTPVETPEETPEVKSEDPEPVPVPVEESKEEAEEKATDPVVGEKCPEEEGESTKDD